MGSSQLLSALLTATLRFDASAAVVEHGSVFVIRWGMAGNVREAIFRQPPRLSGRSAGYPLGAPFGNR